MEQKLMLGSPPFEKYGVIMLPLLSWLPNCGWWPQQTKIISLHLQSQPREAAVHHHLGMRYQGRAFIQTTNSTGLKFFTFLKLPVVV